MKDFELINRVKKLMERDADNPNSFAIKVGIDPGNFRRKLTGDRAITKKDILKICTTDITYVHDLIFRYKLVLFTKVY